MNFTKIQALGNDFVVFGNPSQTSIPSSELIRFLCDRHYGVGADCAVYIAKSELADFSMHVYNPDGFEAEICGNALRCSAKYVSDNGFFRRKVLDCETMSGVRRLSINEDHITVQIGTPKIIEKGELFAENARISYIAVDVGNPHCVVFTSDLSEQEFCILGKAIECHPIFPNGTNVEFATVSGGNRIAMKVWERGIGETLSCSTGSCACAFAAYSEGLVDKTAFVYQKGGIITTKITDSGDMYISGNCTTVFKGNLFYK